MKKKKNKIAKRSADQESIDRSLTYRSLSLRTEAGKPSTFNKEARSVEVVAATENPVEVFDWERWEVVPEILLMSGCRIPKSGQIPLLDTHKREGVSSVLGSARDLSREKSELICRVVFATTDRGSEAMTQVEEGHVTDFSIGYRVNKSVWVPEGETAMIDNREFEGPVKVTTDWTPRELSICPIGADEASKARSETVNNNQKLQGGNEMNEKLRKFLESRGLAKDATEDEAWAFLEKLDLKRDEDSNQARTAADNSAAAEDLDKVRAEAARAEQSRILEIRAMCDQLGYADMAQDLIKGNKTIEEARKMVMDKILADKNTGGAGHRVPVEVGEDERDKFRAAATDSILLRGGSAIEKPALGARDIMGFSLRELAREALRIAGQPVNGSPLEMVGRALTTSDFPYILADSANKSLFEGFDTAEETWREWVATGSVSDFKVHSSVRASETDDLEEVKEDGEYKYGKRSEAREQYQIATYGKLFAISRQTIINDDLNALTDTPRAHGEAAARKIGDVVYAVLIANAAMGDGIALFHADHGNLEAAAAVGVTSLASAIKAMKLQKDLAKKRRLNIRPQFFLSPVALEGSSEQFFISEFEGTQAKPNKRNPYAGRYFTRVYEPRLDDDSTTAWYLAGPKGKTVKVFFLNGVQAPYMETKQGWTVDGVEYKVRIDVGAKAMDYRGLVKNPGA